MLGGQVLEAKRLKNSTHITILQLPLINEQEPTTELTQSQGRFIAEQQDFLDPGNCSSGKPDYPGWRAVWIYPPEP